MFIPDKVLSNNFSFWLKMYALGALKHHKPVSVRSQVITYDDLTATILHHLACESAFSWAECESFSRFTDALLGSHMGFCHIGSLLSMGISTHMMSVVCSEYTNTWSTRVR